VLDHRQLDRQDAVLEARLGSLGVDVLDQPHLALEGAVLDLDLLVDAPGHLRAEPLARDHEQPLAGDDAHGLRVDTGQLHDHRQGVGLVRVEAVDVRPEPASGCRKPRHLPEVGEQLLDLLLQPVDVPARHAGANGTPFQALRSAVRRPAHDAAVAVVQPRWSAWSFLVYAGGLTVLGAVGGWLTYLAARSGAAGYAGWTLVVVALLALLATGLHRTAHPVAAGVLAFVAVIAFVAFVSALWTWFGWRSTSATSSSFGGFHLSQLLLELLWLGAALFALRVFRFPLLTAQAVLAGWILVTDLISNGGDWSAVVTLLVGLGYLAVALALDAGPGRPYGFWLHVGAGLLIGGSLLWFWHSGNFEWLLIAAAAVVYVFFSDVAGRSSWAVLGVVGLLLAAIHFALEWTHVRVAFVSGGSGSSRPWVAPFVFTCLGLLLLMLGLALGRRGSARPAVD